MTRNLILTTLFLSACSTAPVVNDNGSASRLPEPRADVATTTARGVLVDLPHQRVDYWVERFSRGDKRAEIAEAFGRKPAVEAMIMSKLRARDMPPELIYLAMAESGLNPRAHSAAGARGIWQMVPDTARRYGLRVDETVDDRLDVEKSTDAALAHLAKLYARFGSWYLVAAAYNAGENRVGLIMVEQTGNDTGTDADYYRIWERLPGETRDYVPAMIALWRIGRDPGRYGF